MKFIDGVQSARKKKFSKNPRSKAILDPAEIVFRGVVKEPREVGDPPRVLRGVSRGSGASGWEGSSDMHH